MAAVGFIDPSEVRSLFSRAMSDMYRAEVPQYGTLLELVADVNRRTLERDPVLAGGVGRLDVERHGAIRLGTADELFTMRRLFAVMGMQPVGYYDLSVAGVPVHSTAFRPVDDAALARNPFRVFTSLLRLELIEDADLRAEAGAILAARRIFTPGAMELIEAHERQGGLSEPQAVLFVGEALETFRWHREATVPLATYRRLHDAHRLIADVVCFKGPHINHLTPRTLDIDAVQSEMPERGITPKAVIEGPPPRACPILLRQTSFMALEEPILFAGAAAGTHTARFGEVEQRGAALTRKGRQQYDELLARVQPGADYAADLARVFEALPDDWATLRASRLAYFRYRAAKAGTAAPGETLDSLVERGLIVFEPIVYEDFLPASAAGIFKSNLGGDIEHDYARGASRASFEEALGQNVLDEFELYAKAEQKSVEEALAEVTVR